MNEKLNLDNIASQQNNYSNPYISLVTLLKDNVDSSLLHMIEFLSQNTKDNINEKFLFSDNEYTYNYKAICENTILDKLVNLNFAKEFDWDTDFPKSLFQKLFDLGLDFTQETKKYKFQFQSNNQIQEEQFNVDRNFLEDFDKSSMHSFEYSFFKYSLA